MKKQLTLLVILMITVTLFSCRKKENTSPTDEPISTEILNRIKAKGFKNNGVVKVKGGYLVEGDIFLSADDLDKISPSTTLQIANTEQYRTNNLVSAIPRVVTVSVTNLAANYVVAADSAIARYNAQNLRLSFQRVASGGEISIQSGTLPSGVLGSSGTPNIAGNPFPTITLAPSLLDAYGGQGFLISTITHEMGHCIGFRHTDYFNRAYSCGGSVYNEGTGTDGAIQIPGTPSTADPNSFMLACSDGSNRPFNPNDIVALNYLYGAPPTYSITMTVSSALSASTEIYFTNPTTGASVYSAGFGGSGSFSSATKILGGTYNVRIVRNNGVVFNVKIGNQTNTSVTREVTNTNVTFPSASPFITVY